MQLSKYNILSHSGNKVLIFNSLSGNFACCDEQSSISLYLQGRLKDLPLDDKNILLNKGFVVEKPELEKLKAQKKLYDFIYDNTLDLVIMPTMQCNFRCIYCYEDFVMGKMSEEAIESITNYLRRSLSKHSGLSIGWFGGEPLLAIRQMELLSEQAIKLCSYLKIPYSSSIVTNGYLLTPDVIKKLLKMRVYKMQITIDGTEKFHNKNRVLADGKGTFQKIINNLLYIRDNIKSANLQIFIRCNISQTNINDMSRFVNQLNEQFGTDRRFKFYFHPIEDWGGNKVNQIKNELLQGADLFFNTLLEFSSKIQIENSFKALQSSAMCNSIKINHFAIDPNLNIYKCSLYKNDQYSRIGKLIEGEMVLDDGKLEQWSFSTFNEYAHCLNECPMFANCFARICPYKMNGDKIFYCKNKIEKVSKMLEINYKLNPSKYEMI